MELWEKEYLDAIKISKTKLNNHPQDIHFNNSCWEEVIRPDGSKYYIPKQDAFCNLEKSQQGKKQLFNLLRNFLKRSLALKMIILVLLAFLTFRSYFTDFMNQMSEVFHFISVPNTYMNGRGLMIMADTLWNIKDRQTEKLSEYIESGFSEDEINSWLESIDEDLATIDRLIYDDSYSEVVSSYTLLLKHLQEFICHEKAGNKEASIISYNNFVALYHDLHSIFMKALESNGVDYSIDESRLTFSYFPY